MGIRSQDRCPEPMVAQLPDPAGTFSHSASRPAAEAARLHTPVLLERCAELLEPALLRTGGTSPVLVDATLGMGGHAEEFLSRFPRLRLVGVDRDGDALRLAGERLARFADRTLLLSAIYDALPELLPEYGITRVDAILFDLGVSSLQLDRVERGFSYSRNAPLDMRMDSRNDLTAARVLAEYSETQLRQIFFRYGEEKLAARYARRIVQRRAERTLTTSAELVDLIEAATPAAVQRTGHPAKRVFQALRIEVNGELDALERAIPAALNLLSVGGRMVVLAYQSLEDRIVKREFIRRSSSSAPAGLPVELPEHQAEFRLLVRGAGRAEEREIRSNPRAAPVRLRAIERVVEHSIPN